MRDDDWIEWVEPLGDGAEPLYMRATAADIAAVRRRQEPRYESDERAVEDFMVVHWATRRPADLPAYERQFQHEMTELVMSHIDRMNDVCDQDEAESIIASFTSKFDPLFSRYIFAKFPNRNF